MKNIARSKITELKAVKLNASSQVLNDTIQMRRGVRFSHTLNTLHAQQHEANNK